MFIQVFWHFYCSDPSWLLGSNQNGEGLFPANFVTSDLSEPAKVEKTVQFNDEVKVKTLEMPVEEVVIDEVSIFIPLFSLKCLHFQWKHLFILY